MVAGWLVALVVGGAVGWWAADATLSRPVPVAGTAAPTLYTVPRGEVGRTVTFSAEAGWGSTTVASNAADGTVTGVVARGERMGEGDALYQVDLRPVVIAEGRIPSFRDLTVGDVGADVAQLERMLAQRVPFAGTVDDQFTLATQAAVEAWQTELGIKADGRVRRGDVVYVRDLPARIVLGSDITVGARVSAGAGTIGVLDARPKVTVTLSSDQRNLVPLDGEVIVHHGNGRWKGKIDSSTVTDSGGLVLDLAGRQGGSICGSECDRIPVGRTSVYRTDLVAVEPRTGPVVPSSALRTTASGKSVVVDESGARIRVEIVAAAGGRAVVKGVQVGDRIRLYADPEQAVP